MTANSALPPAGWYPDPEIPGQMRWWDGVQWQASQAPQRAVVGGGFRGLAWSLVGLLGVHLLLAIALCAVSAWGATFAEDERDLGTDRYYDMLLASSVLMVLFGVALVVTAPVWLTWQFRLAKATLPGAVRRTPGWQVGSWFIPFVSLFFPCQNMRDLWRVFIGRKGLALVGWWWAGYILLNLMVNIWSTYIDSDGELTSVHSFTMAGLVASGISGSTAALAVAMVLRLTNAALDRDDPAAARA